MKIRNQTDFASGLLYIIVGTCAAYIASGYTMGTPGNMGTGFFPFWLGVFLVAIGVVICALSVLSGAAKEKMSSWNWKSLLWVAVSLLAFALLFEAAGMVLSIFALVFISSLASSEFRWKGAIANACVLNVICYAAFVRLLNIPLRVWPGLWF